MPEIAAEVCKAASPIDLSLQRLSSEIEELTFALNGHTSRLSSVTSPAEVSSPNTIGPDYPGGSEVVQSICKASDLISDLTVRIRSLSGILET